MFLALSSWLVVPAGVSYFTVVEEDVEGQKIVGDVSPSPSPLTMTIEPTHNLSGEDDTEDLKPVSLPSSIPVKSPSPKPVAAVPKSQEKNTSSNCDFEYHVDTHEKDSGAKDVHVEHTCTQESSGGSVDNDVDIAVNTGGGSSDGRNDDAKSSGDVTIDVSIKNKIE